MEVPLVMNRVLISRVPATAFVACLLSGVSAAELTFHAPFDGTPVASVAKGVGKPQIVRGLEYAPGVDGQAVNACSWAIPYVHTVLPVAETTEAHAILKRGENRGKVVLKL